MKLVTITMTDGRERLGAQTDKGIVDLTQAATLSGRGDATLAANMLAFLIGFSPALPGYVNKERGCSRRSLTLVRNSAAVTP